VEFLIFFTLFAIKYLFSKRSFYNWLFLLKKDMAAKSNRAEMLLNKLAVRTGMTERGKNWLIAAMDPFHDLTLDVTGYPDAPSGSSIVQIIKQTTQISSASGVAYDCLIHSDNFMSNIICNNLPLTGNIVTPSGAPTTAAFCGGVQAIIGNVGTNLSNVPLPQNVNTGFLAANLQIPNSFARRRFRIIGFGYEVHNITAELNKQGAVTVFEQQQSRDPFTTFVTNAAGSSISGVISANYVQLPPSSVANALLLQGSKTWDASAGAYVVATMNDIVNPPRMAEVVAPMAITTVDSAYPNNVAQTVWMPNNTQNSGVFFSPPMNVCTPYNSKGMYFSNLSSTTVLQLNANWIIERFPSEIDGDLTVLATPSCEYDPIALEAYARMCRILPVGVPVSENGFGDWFFGEVSSLIDCLTGTNFAGGINRSLSNWADRDKAQAGNDWVSVPRPVQIVRKPLPPIPKKSKPLPPIPQRKALPPVPYSSFTRPKPNPPKKKKNVKYVRDGSGNFIKA